ncbi:hypothetical protein ACFWYW_59100 [Nonomuraea sp. NPDC059023]|uniref:hypothetical protein n=1 Tax=unclassified Nonomuraea TaxID=2593643 RepID=UPI0036B985EF
MADVPEEAVQAAAEAIGRAMTEDERCDLIDLLPDGMVIWDDESELDAFPWGLRRWLDVLGHRKKHTACCEACGCATTCMAGAFHDALVSSVVRELDKLGALRQPERITNG